MRGGPVERALRWTLLASVAAGLLAVAALTVLGSWRAGLALGAGLAIGGLNGRLALRTLSDEVSFRAASLGRLAVLSVAGLGVGFLIGTAVMPLTLVGIGASQLLLAGLSAREALRA